MTVAHAARSPVSRWSKSRWLPGASLVAIVVIVYLRVIFTAGWIWDDPQYIIGNPVLRTWRGLLAIWIHPTSIPQYYPLVHTTFWIEYHLVGLHPWLYHVDNVLLHALGAVLLWRLLERLNVPAAWLAAGIFAVHPVQLESVAWATERKNVLSLVLYFLSFHAYLSFLHGSHTKCYALSLICFVAALLSKSVTCSLPAAILLVIYWQTGRIRWKDIWPLVPFFVIGAGMAFVTARIEKEHVGATGAEWAFTFSHRCLIAGRALWFYANKLIYPHPLVFIYPRWTDMTFAQRPWLVLFPLSAVCAIVTLWILRSRIGRGPLIAVLLFSGTLLPALGFINLYPMRYSFVADHFQYHACIALIILAAAGLRRIHWLASAAILVILSCLTWAQAPVYQNQMALWSDVVKKNPTSWMAWGNLGDEYADLSNQTDLPQDVRDKDRAEAKNCYSMLYQLAPNQPIAHWKWGIVKELDGDLDGAQAEFLKSLNLAPDFTLVMNSMGLLLAQEGKPEQAIDYYRRAISLDPGYAEVRVNYGNLLLDQGDNEGALQQYLQAAAQRPDHVEAQFKAGNMLLTEEHDPTAAIPHYIAAVMADPNRADLRSNLAAALLSLGRVDEAREQCAAALKINPNLPQARALWAKLGG
jgi:tetratricopeptide (TPR) repeat protein